MRRAIAIVGGCAALVAASVTQSAAVTAEPFQLRSGADLVELCSTPPDDPLRAAAIHFCHGYGTGVFQTLLQLSAARGLDPLFCPASAPLTRNQMFDRFLAWAQNHKAQASEAAVDFVARFLVSEFPCTAGAGGGK